MKWNRLLLIPIVFAGLASIGGTGSDDGSPAKTLTAIPATTCPAASIVVSISIKATQPGGGDWVTTATGSVTCTSTTPATPLAGVEVGINWPWNEQTTATTDSAGNFTKISSKKAGQPSGAATAGVQPGPPAGSTTNPSPVTGTSNKL